MNRVEIHPQLLRWAIHRAGASQTRMALRFPRLADWLGGVARPTLKQLEAFAKATYTPVGYFFLPEPPVEAVPIPDFRTVGSVPIDRPSANLLDMIYVCQQRQEWYRDFARSSGEPSLPFVGSVRLGADVVTVATDIRKTLGFDLDERARARTWEEALRTFISNADDAGIMVMCSGIVKSNTHRKLDPAEFRGLAIAEPLAPLIFVKGADTKSAQMFTLAHELVHVWLGQTALSNAQASELSASTAEQWCNAVAAELLVPIDQMRETYDRTADLNLEMARLARRFKVSTLVILRRIFDVGVLTRDEFWSAYAIELERLRGLRPESGGGDFHLTEAVRVSRRFARALVASTLEGQTLYRDAFRMLGFSKMGTFNTFGRSLGIES